MKRAMIDIEAFDRRESAVILSVGVVDITSLIGYEFHPSLVEQELKGRTVGVETAQWWTEQEEAARVSTLSTAIYRETTADSAARIMGIVGEADEIWASGTSYDMKILASFVRMHAPYFEWPLWKERDFRTMRALFDPEGRLRPDNTIAHNALADATYQATYLQRIESHLATWKPPS